MPALPTSGPALALGQALPYPSVGHHKPRKPLGSGHTHQCVNISSRTPWAPQPAMSKTQ